MDPYFPFLVLVIPYLTTLIILSLPRIRHNIQRKYRLPGFIGLSLMTLVGLFFSFSLVREYNETKNLSFKGVIQKAYYEKPKNIPNITINEVEYDLNGLNYSDYDTIVAGDSAVKLRGTFTFKLIRLKR